jgi:hypothetical protein
MSDCRQTANPTTFHTNPYRSTQPPASSRVTIWHNCVALSGPNRITPILRLQCGLTSRAQTAAHQDGDLVSGGEGVGGELYTHLLDIGENEP